ncbi:MAG TPA: winged helix-turn-helix domain-containing protein [Steroidobacteraceae bacterium]|nr:winged helix-turn-helix domain-containing protein [Steroidobacteraceae bacterium]
MATARSYELDGFRVDAARRELLKASGERPELPSRAYDALVYLIERRGEDVSREALMRAVWPDTIVDDNNLNQLISDLRRVFGDSRSQPRYIATVPGRGYRFVGKVQAIDEASARSPTPAPAATLAPRYPVSRSKLVWLFGAGIVVAIALTAVVAWQRSDRSPAPVADKVPTASSLRLAILPFENLSPDPANAFFTDGLHEEVLSTIAQRLPQVEVISRTTMMSYRGRAPSVAQLAKDLGSTHVLEGSVRREGQALRVTLHLIDGRTDNRLWSHSYDRQLVTATTLQSEIAADVAARLPVKFASTSPSFEASRNPDSYDAYLKALLAFRNQAPGVTREDVQSVIDLLDLALRHDPDFAAAYLLRAQVHLRMFTIAYDNSEGRLSMARSDIDRAKALVGETPRYLAVEGVYALNTERDLSRAIALFDAARPLTHTDSSFMSMRASLLMRLSRMDESVALWRENVARDPSNHRAHVELLMGLYAARRPADAFRTEQFLRERFPQQPAWQLISAQLRFGYTGELDAWRAAEAAIVAPVSAGLLFDSRSTLLRVEGRYAEARAVIDSLDEEMSRLVSYNGMLLYAAGRVPKSEARGWINLLLKDPAQAAVDGNSLASFVAREPKQSWNDWLLQLLIAESALFCGQREQAIEAADRAMAVVPRSQDATTWRYLAVTAAKVYAWSGAAERAVALLEILTSEAPGIGPAQVTRDPLFSVPLAGNARYLVLEARLEAEIEDNVNAGKL